MSDRGSLGLLLLIVFSPLQQRWRGNSNWVSGWVGARVDYSFEIANHFQTSHVSCRWWGEESYWFSLRGSVINLIGRWHSGNYYTITQYLSFFIHIIAVAVRSEEEVLWRRGPPLTYFCPALDPPLGGSGWKTTTLVGDREYFIPTKFHQNP